MRGDDQLRRRPHYLMPSEPAPGTLEADLLAVRRALQALGETFTDAFLPAVERLNRLLLSSADLLARLSAPRLSAVVLLMLGASVGGGTMLLVLGVSGPASASVSFLLLGAGWALVSLALDRRREDAEDGAAALREAEREADYALWLQDPFWAELLGADRAEMTERAMREARREDRARSERRGLERAAAALAGSGLVVRRSGFRVFTEASVVFPGGQRPDTGTVKRSCPEPPPGAGEDVGGVLNCGGPIIRREDVDRIRRAWEEGNRGRR